MTTNTVTKPSVTAMVERLRAEISNGLKLNFDYTGASGETQAVVAFTPESLRQINGDVLLTGLNSHGWYRSYYIGRMAHARVLATA